VDVVRIETAEDGRLAEFRNVPDPELLSRLGLFIAEGRFVVARLLSSGLQTRALLATEPAAAALEPLLVNRTFPVYVVPQSVMNGVTGFNFHRGCLAIGVRPPARDWRAVIGRSAIAGSEEQDPAYVCGMPDPAHVRDMPDAANERQPRRLVVLERIGNVDNIGSIFRSARAFGVDGVLLQEDCAEPLYRKAIRTSMAATLTLPYARAPWPDALHELQEQGWATIAMTPADTAAPLREVVRNLAGRSIAIVLGHEGDGLTSEAMAACTHRARISIAREVDSLNVATAAAIALYEVRHLETTPRITTTRRQPS
jgi:tRNA G18 (ribose-2'-O)-methylase SpoU